MGFLSKLFFRKKVLDDEFIEELEERLVESDVGITTTERIIEILELLLKKEKFVDIETVKKKIREILYNIILEEDIINNNGLNIILFTGVNGVGKTTSIAKLANFLKNKNFKVKIAAADTFRTAAIEQLAFWTEKIKIPLIKHNYGSDSGSVVYDAISSCLANNFNYLLVDTAGRMHTSNDLMRELQKIYRIASKRVNPENIENILTIDATGGQNSFVQAKTFNQYLPVTGIFLSKYDSSSRGGIVIRIASELKIPVKFLGTGEKIDNIEVFNKQKFIHEII